MAKHSSQILEMARKGAEHRYQELKAEIAALLAHFPHLGRQTGTASRARAAGAAVTAESTPRRRSRKRMSAAARKAVSDRMKKYWAARRKTKKG
ncbi:MAG TPA: hypothetical protein VHU82_09525 [Vicinamibacterales bacterium]|jgi:hypothetical protein|nr:hypothetical protein [Vicinamibacterales bacterium]